MRATSRSTDLVFLLPSTGRTLINRDKFSRGLARGSKTVDRGAWWEEQRQQAEIENKRTKRSSHWIKGKRFLLRTVRCLNRVCRKAVQSPSMPVFNAKLDEALFNLIWPQSWPCFGQYFELQSFWGHFQTEFSYVTTVFVKEVLGFYLKSSPLLSSPYPTHFLRLLFIYINVIFQCCTVPF